MFTHLFHSPVTTPPPGRRRLKLECPQRPGVVLAITELLKDHGCSLSGIDADTVARGDIFGATAMVYDLLLAAGEEEPLKRAMALLKDIKDGEDIKMELESDVLRSG